MFEEAIKPLLAAMYAHSSEASGKTLLSHDQSLAKPLIPAVLQLPIEEDLPSLDGATTWLNSPPLTPAELRGKVVLIDFWTYTCINWLRSLPYIRAWAEKYKEQGLVVIGVHSPEFAFEKDLVNVRQAAQTMQVDYPIAVDNNYAIWRAFSNHYWPALYITDAQGHIRYHQFGEGYYEQAERVIQQLLDETGNDGIDYNLVSIKAEGASVPADWDSLRSFENYLGYERTENFGSPGGTVLDKPRFYRLPGRLRLNHWALAGNWTIGKGAAVLNQAGGRLTYRFQARDLHLVMASSTQGTAVRFRVLLDGYAPGAAHGSDLDNQGYGTLSQPRLYQLIRQPDGITAHLFEIEFEEAGVEIFAFTFG
jgi:thiol-disulfide isomerase/thioredoxin